MFLVFVYVLLLKVLFQKNTNKKNPTKTGACVAPQAKIVLTPGQGPGQTPGGIIPTSAQSSPGLLPQQRISTKLYPCSSPSSPPLMPAARRAQSTELNPALLQLLPPANSPPLWLIDPADIQTGSYIGRGCLGDVFK